MRSGSLLTTFVIGFLLLVCGQADAGRKKYRGRFVPGALRGGQAVQARQNLEAKRYELPRIPDLEALRKLIGDRTLARVENTAAYRLTQIAEADTDNEADYRHVLPHVKVFLDHETPLAQRATGRKKPFAITSLVRTDAYQQALCELEETRIREAKERKQKPPTRSATCGEEWWETSAHVYGTAVDIRIRGMNPHEIRWWKRRLARLERAGVVVAIRERKAFHVMVSPSYVRYILEKEGRKTKRPSRGRACSLPA